MTPALLPVKGGTEGATVPSLDSPGGVRYCAFRFASSGRQEQRGRRREAAGMVLEAPAFAERAAGTHPGNLGVETRLIERIELAQAVMVPRSRAALRRCNAM